MGTTIENIAFTLRQELVATYPALDVVIEDGTIFLRGFFQLVKDGYRFDTYEIEVSIPAPDSHNIPVVKETGGRIPKISDRHINPDGTACLFLPDERFRLYPPGSTVRDFLDGPVWNYFYSQSYFEEYGTWPFGEFRHGLDGILDFYSDLTGLQEPLRIFKFLSYLVARKVKPHWGCYCGSGVKLNACHAELLTRCREQILRRDAVKSYQLLKMELSMDSKWSSGSVSQLKITNK